MEAPGQGCDVRLSLLGHGLGPLLQMPQASAGRLGILITDDVAHMVDPPFTQSIRVKGQSAGQELIQDHAERVDVRAYVNVLAGGVCLFGAHVFGGADQPTLLREQGVVRQGTGQGLGDPKIDYLGHGLVVHDCHQQVRRLEIPMDNPLLMRMVDRVTNL